MAKFVMTREHRVEFFNQLVKHVGIWDRKGWRRSCYPIHRYTKKSMLEAMDNILAEMVKRGTFTDTKKPTLSEIAALWDKATPGDWVVRAHPVKDDFFVEAPAPEGAAYGTEILGDEEYPTKRADAEAIVKAKAYHPYLLDLVARMRDFAESVSSFEKDGMVVTGKGPTMLLVNQACALLEELKK